MCLAVPALIQTIHGQTAHVEMGGVRREISLAFTPQAQVGDYVTVHAGFAIGVLDEQEARETIELFAQISSLTTDEIH